MITLDEARALECLSRHDSVADAAKELGKSNSSVVYALDAIEEKTGLAVFDRTGYRTTLSDRGARLLEASRKLLGAEAEFAAVCREMRDGWESDLRVVVEGVVPLEPVLRTVARLSRKRAPTRFHVRAGYLSEVERMFGEIRADLMISVLPPQRESLAGLALSEVPARLVAHRDHALAASRKTASLDELRRHALLTVRGSDPRLNMSTAILEPAATIELHDFHSKKAALLNGLGFGWMPNYLIEAELRRGALKTVRWKGSSTHRFRPYLYFREGAQLGRTGRAFRELVQAEYEAMELG